MDNPRGPKWWKATLPEILPFVLAAEAALLNEEVRFQGLYRFSDLPRGAIPFGFIIVAENAPPGVIIAKKDFT